jgi:hypothetical protein
MPAMRVWPWLLIAACSGAAPVATPVPKPPPPPPPPPPDAAVAFAFDAPPEKPSGPNMSPGDVFALGARGQVTFYWKQPSGACDTWTVDGERMGTLERTEPKPALHLRYTLDGDSLALAGTPANHALGESPEAACMDRLDLGKDDSSKLVVGDSAWYFSPEACAAGKLAPTSCAASVANVWREAARDRDPLPKVMKSNADVFILDIHQGKVTCDRWQFAQGGRRLEQHTTDGMTYYGATFAKDQLTLTGPNDVSKSGTVALGGLLQLPVVAVAPDAYTVGPAAWFTDEEACERVRRPLVR